MSVEKRKGGGRGEKRVRCEVSVSKSGGEGEGGERGDHKRERGSER